MPEIKTTKLLLGLILLAAILRLFTLNDYPLTDKTDSRYAEIGREMFVSGNWVTPQIDQGSPFWAKPPLSMWLTAASYTVFGVNEFSARLPSYLLGGAVMWLIFLLTQHLYGRYAAIICSAILISSFQFLLMQGGVMTDPALGFSITLMTVSFILAMDTGSRFWGYLLFVGAGIGLLAKGPIALILTGMPVFIWLFWKAEWKNFATRLPWLGGLALMTAIALPWYLLAESRTPGFFQYFFVGEHYLRFTDPHWAGDLYGKPHPKVKGTIWFYWLTATLPWSLLFIGFVISRITGRSKNRLLFNKSDKWVGLILLWSLSPMIFFTTAGSLTWAYVYPAVPAFALLVTLVLLQRNTSDNTLQLKPYWLTLALVFIVPLVSNIVLMNSYNKFSQGATQIPLLKQFDALAEKDSKLLYACERPTSADFYAHDRTIAMQNANEEDWKNIFSSDIKHFVVIDKTLPDELPEFLRSRMQAIGHLREYVLLMDTGAAAGN